MSTATRIGTRAHKTGCTCLEVVAAARIARDLSTSTLVPVVYTPEPQAPDPLDLPAYWCSGFWAARLIATGPHTFLAPDPPWLARLPEEFLGRQLRSGTLGDLFHPWQRPLFVSLAQHESRVFTSRVHPNVDSLLAHAFGAFPGRSPEELRGLATIVSQPVAFTQEFRCFVAHARVSAVSHTRTRRNGVETTWKDHSQNGGPDTRGARRFAQEVADAMGDDQPPGYCLDVGRLEGGRWAVVDAGPAWSADPCRADPDGAVAAILASQSEAPLWGWRPDPLTAAAAQPLPPSVWTEAKARLA